MSLLGDGKHDVPCLIFRNLNYDTIKSVIGKDLITHIGLWNKWDDML